MEKRKLLKIGIVILLLTAAGTFYSCRGNRDTGTVLSFENSTEEEPVSDAASGSGNQENSITVQENGNNSVTDAVKPELTAAKDNSSDDTGDKPELTAANGNSSDDTGDKPGDTETSVNNNIYIYICGAVEKPDVYKVEADTRLVEVIELAGGLTKDAAGDYVNQAALVQDGQKVYIPTKEEVKGTVPEGYPGNQDSAGGNTLKADTTVKSQDNGSGKVNINKASAEELMTLPGIGEAKAAGIIAYRQEQGGFKSIEEIMNINGIKNSVFNKISDKITVD